MPQATTLGRNVDFTYNGSVVVGVDILYENATISVSSSFLNAILHRFSNSRVAGGFLRHNPEPNGFGEWVRDNSHHNTDALTPQHASRIAAILVAEGYATSTVVGRSVYITFF